MKNKRTFFKKLFTFFIINSLLLAGIFFISAKIYIESANENFFAEELRTNAQTISPFITHYILSNDLDDLAVTVNSISSHLNKRITVMDPEGKVIADSQNLPSLMANHSDRDEVKAVLNGSLTGRSIRHSSTLQEDMLYMAAPIDKDGRLIAVLRLSMPIRSINLFTRATLENILVVVVFVFFISFITAYIVSRKMTSGISELRNAVLYVASGNFDTKVDVKSKDEIGDLADSFNLMAEEIDVLFKQVKEGKEMLDKVLSSVSDGILLIDADGKTLLFNDALKRMFAGAKEERPYWEFLRSKEIENDLPQIMNGLGKAIYGSFVFENTVYSYGIAKVASEDKFVISVADITKEKQLENFKKDFIANASHELKTPVTSIAGFAETLGSENLDDESRHYVEVIKKQAQRLSNIVNDLLSISSLESQKTVEKEEINVVNVIGSVINLYRKKLSDKEINLKVEIQEDLKDIYANEFNIEQLIVNLVDNAVKYSEKGEIVIKAVNTDDDNIRLTVSDTGIGIAEEHIPRLFERFYVVDKSRARTSGGTGLGLSIVKHIVNAHNGTISVKSREGKGTEFDVLLPVNSNSM